MLLSLKIHGYYITLFAKKHYFLKNMKKNVTFDEKKIIAAVFLLLSAVYISLVWNNNVWMDEAFTASLVHTDLAGVISRSMADTLPPLYNIILKFTTDVFGYTVPVMKMTSVVPMLLTLLAGATTVRKRFGIRTAVLFMLLITFMPLVLYYGVEIRMYSMGFLFATLSGIWAYENVCEPSVKNLAVFTVVSTLAGYTHHFAFVTAAFAYLYLLLWYIFFDRKNLKRWFGALAATFVLYLPCLIVTLSQLSRVSGYFSMPDIDVRQFLEYVVYPYKVGITPLTVLCLMFAAAALVMFFYTVFYRKNRDAKYIFAILCFSVYYGVLVFGTIISKIMTANIFVDRYLFFAVGLLWMFAAIMFSDDKRIFTAAILVTLIVGAGTYSTEIKTEYGNSADEEIAFLRDNVGKGDVLFCIGQHEELQNCIPFYTYLDSEGEELTFVYPLENAIETARDNGTVLWIAILEGYEPSDEQLRILKNNSLSLQKQADFEFDRYRCALYTAEPDTFVKK